MKEGEALTALVTEAIFNSLAQEKRDELVKQALQGLIEPQQRGTYGDRKSRLEEAFEQATFQTAQAIVREHLAKDATWRAKIKSLVDEAFVKVLEDDTRRTELVCNMADAIQKAFTVRDR